MKKTIHTLFFAAVLSTAACVDRDTVDRNPTDGVFNGGHPSRSPNHDSVNNTNATGLNNTGSNQLQPDGTQSNDLNASKTGINPDIYPQSDTTKKNETSNTQKSTKMH